MRLRLFLARRAAEARMDEEFRFHLEMEAERIVRETGVDPSEARRRAIITFGSVERHKDALREGRGPSWRTGLSLDLKLALRMLVKSPGLTLVGVVGMAVAVAIGAVASAIIDQIVGARLPLDEGDRVVVVQNVDVRHGREGDATHLHDLATWRATVPAIRELGAYRIVARNLISRDARPEPVRVAEMTASGFRVARVAPLMGRFLDDGDERPGAPFVAVIGYDVWQRRFGGARDVVGRSVQIGATLHTVIGVMPEGFAFPVSNRVWTPLRLDPLRFPHGEAPPVRVFGRLARGAGMAEAQTQLALAGRRLAAEHPASHEHVRPRVLPYAASQGDRDGMAWTLYLVQLAISMLLVVIGTNVATLVYARTASRMGEIAVRTALGAGRGRIVRQLFLEALALSAVAAAVGLGGAEVALRWVREWARRFSDGELPFWIDYGLSRNVVLYVIALAVLGAVIVGVLPALKATGRGVQGTLRQVGAGASGLRLGRTWTVLIVTQVAVAVALLPCVVYTVLLQRPPAEADAPTFDTASWLTARLTVDRDDATARAEGAAEDAARLAVRHAALRAELVRRLEAAPGVADVVLTSAPPGDEPSTEIVLDRVDRVLHRGPVAASPDTSGLTHRWTGAVRVDPAFFRAFGVPVVAGRGFTAGDASAAATSVIVNQTFARHILGGGNPLGRRVRAVTGTGDGEQVPNGPWYEVVGVVPDFPTPPTAFDVHAVMYQPLPLDSVPVPTLAVRVRGRAPASFAGRLREIAVAVDPMLRLDVVRPLDEAPSVDRMYGQVVWTAVAGVASSGILLSAAGIYALVSFTVVRRRREIGIRAALGAGPRHVLAGVLARTAGQIGVGMGIGLATAAVVVRSLAGETPISRNGVLLAAGAACLTVVVALGAASGPARRALRVQPTEALRAE